MYLADKLSLQAFALEASAAGQTPAIASGVHLRLVPSVALGLPAAPTLVYRIDLTDADAELDGLWRTDAYFRDFRGMQAVFNQPITGTVTGHLGVPVEDACLHVELQASPGSKLVVQGLISDGFGGGKLVAVRSEPPYSLSGFGIDTLVVTGTGQITNVRWISLRSLLLSPRFPLRLVGQKPWAIWNLPVTTDRNYLGSSDPLTRARQRVIRGAPPHWPSAARLGLDAMSAAKDLARIEGDPELHELLNGAIRASDPRAPIQVDVDDLARGPGMKQAGAKASYRPLAQLLAASTEASVARWFGLADVDPSPASPGTITAYVMRTFWSVDRGNLPKPSTAYPEQSLFRTHGELPELVKRWLSPVLAPTGDYRSSGAAREGFDKSRTVAEDLVAELDLGGKRSIGDLTIAERMVAALVRVGAPPLPPPEPSRATVQVSETWRQDPEAAEPSRVATISVDGMVEGGGLALTRKVGTSTSLLNPPGPGNIGVAMLGGPPQGTGATVTTRVLVDDGCPASAATYAVAQRDWAGQWSRFVDALPIPAGQRLAPPEPILEVRFTPIDATPPTTTTAASGTFTLSVTVPSAAPGSYPLVRLELELGDARPIAQRQAFFDFNKTTGWIHSRAGSPKITTHTSTGVITLRVDIAGPALLPASREQVPVYARWVDSQGAKTEVSHPGAQPGTRVPGLLFAAVDPRPPTPPVFDTQIRMTSRPDPSGLAWLRVDLPTAPGVAAYRAYMSDDGVAAKFLGTQLPTDFADSSRQAKANALETKAEQLERGVFELVGERVSVEQGPSTFVHPLAGASTGLILLRLVPESADGAAVLFANAPLLMFAVPDVSPPAQPALVVQSTTIEGNEFIVTLRVEFASGGPAVGAVRVRRTRTSMADPLRMPIVAIKDVPANTPSITVEDRLPLAAAWVTITWVAEARSAGAAASTTWSPPSTPAQRVIIPEAVPGTPTSLVLDPDRKALRISHPFAARHPGFRIALSLDEDALPERGVDSLSPVGDTLLWRFDEPLANGCEVTVIVRDPRNRPSSPLTLVT